MPSQEPALNQAYENFSQHSENLRAFYYNEQQGIPILFDRAVFFLYKK
jgi:hypothetical protein